MEAVFGNSGVWIILHTSWVIVPIGKNFALTLLRLHHGREQLGVVSDQVGCPSSTLHLATICWNAVRLGSKHEQPLLPVLHWSDTGAASWFDVSVAVEELSLELGLLKRAAQMSPIQTSDYPTPAIRPGHSLFECKNTRSALGLEAIPNELFIKSPTTAIP